MWQPGLDVISCMQAGRDARERAIRFFAAAATWCRIYSRDLEDESWESFEVNLDMAFAELAIAHYWIERVDRC